MKSFWGIVPRYIIKNKKRVSSIAVGIVLGITLIMSLSIIQEAWTKALIQAKGLAWRILRYKYRYVRW